MSAIAGIVNHNETVVKQCGEQMMLDLKKYPADDVQTWYKESVFMGCHAQWITPESIGEQLPYYDYEKQLTITADVMLDNRKELFDRLDIPQEERKIVSDSQLILLAYLKWEEKVVNHLIGDFAFMIWDEKEHTLFGARDFSGTRPLYFCHHSQGFAFCTVMEPLFRLPYIKKQLNEEWLAEYLAIPNMIDSVDVSQTVIKDIQQLPPSHVITVKKGKVSLSKYNVLFWDNKIRYKTDEEYTEAFRNIFQGAVDARLRTHKAVGSQLSGGLDSGSVVSFAAKTLKKQNKKLLTYSSIPLEGFEDWTPSHHITDERPLIRSTVDYVGNIEDRYLSFAKKNSYTDIDNWLQILETPYKFFENSFWIKGIFEQARKDGIGILLSGARGNFTISWGPALEYYSHLIKRLKWVRFYRELKEYSRNIGVGRSKVLQVINKRVFPFLNREDDYQFPMLINPTFAKKMNVYPKLQNYGIGTDGFPDISFQNEREYLLGNEFVWNTNGTSFAKLSLRNGLMMRDPTNDVRVINYCMSLPVEQFIQNGMDRALIRKATEGYLPNKVRLNYIHYGVQAADWIYRMLPNWSDFLGEIKQLLKDEKAREYFHLPTLNHALSVATKTSKENIVPSPELRILMRSIVVYRFLQSLDEEGGDTYEKGMERAQSGVARY